MIGYEDSPKYLGKLFEDIFENILKGTSINMINFFAFDD
jgi:hypothetical protein